MVGLPDIATLQLKHTIRDGVEVEYTGLSAKSLTALYNRFPEVKKAVATRSFEALTMEVVIELIPSIGTAVIAAAVGKAGDKKTEESASVLAAGEQVEFVGKILKATFPKGLDSFKDALDVFGLSGEFSAKLRAVNGMARDGNMPLPSTESSAMEISPQK